MHFFNPAQRMPLVEIIRREATPPRACWPPRCGSPSVCARRPCWSNNREGFLVNRLFIPYLKEAFWLLEEGAEPQAIDAAMVEFGFPDGPAGVDRHGGARHPGHRPIACCARPFRSTARFRRSSPGWWSRATWARRPGRACIGTSRAITRHTASDVAADDHRRGRAAGSSRARAPRRDRPGRDRRAAGAAHGRRGVSRPRRGRLPSASRISTWPWCWAPAFPISAAG